MLAPGRSVVSAGLAAALPIVAAILFAGIALGCSDGPSGPAEESGVTVRG